MKLMLLGENADRDPRYRVDVLKDICFPPRDSDPCNFPDIFVLMAEALIMVPRAAGTWFEADDEAIEMMKFQFAREIPEEEIERQIAVFNERVRQEMRQKPPFDPESLIFRNTAVKATGDFFRYYPPRAET